MTKFDLMMKNRQMADWLDSLELSEKARDMIAGTEHVLLYETFCNCACAEDVEELANPKWYAVQSGEPDDNDWGTGSYYLAEAWDMLDDMYPADEYPNSFIAVIDERNESDLVCVDEIRREANKV